MLTSFQAPILQREPKNLYGRNRVKVYPPAKINIYLNIIGEYSNGFHKIESIINRINLFDEITIERAGGSSINFSCNNKSLDNDNNLCVKALRFLRRRFELGGLKIHLNKGIPIGAGLGGGSSDAAYTLLGVDKLLGLGLSKRELFNIGSHLGSDVNFFIAQSSWAYIGRKGEDVEPLDIDAKLKYLLVYPNISTSTKLVYEGAGLNLTKFLDNVNILKYALRKRDYLLVEELSFNCLEKSALCIYKELESVRTLFRRGGFFCRLSGSGSTFFTILGFPPYKRINIDILVNKFREKGFFVFAAQTY